MNSDNFWWTLVPSNEPTLGSNRIHQDPLFPPCITASSSVTRWRFGHSIFNFSRWHGWLQRLLLLWKIDLCLPHSLWKYELVWVSCLEITSKMDDVTWWWKRDTKSRGKNYSGIPSCSRHSEPFSIHSGHFHQFPIYSQPFPSIPSHSQSFWAIRMPANEFFPPRISLYHIWYFSFTEETMYK